MIEITSRDRISELSFAAPTQVLFLSEMDESERVVPISGIAFGDNVICMCCGGVIPMDEIVYLKYDESDYWEPIDWEMT